MLSIGHGAERVTVEQGEPMGGYADRPSGVDGTLDPLEAHAISLTDGVHRFVLVTVDLICVNTDLVAQVRDTVGDRLGVDSCWVSATHTHASPEAGCHPGGAATPEPVAARVVRACVAAIERAVAQEEACSVHPVRALVGGLAGPRNAPPSEQAVLPVDAVAFAAEGGIRGLLTVTPVHPTVFGADNNAVSADLVGGIRRALAARTNAWVVSATGAAGDVSTRHTRTARSSGEIARLGQLVADALLPLTVEAEGVDEGVLAPPIRRRVDLLPKTPGELADLPRLLTGEHSDAETRSESVLRQGAVIAAGLAADARTAPYAVDLEVVRLGPVLLVAVPGELFLALGEEIRARLAASSAAIVLGYTNGYLGYLPTHDAGPCYEVLASPVTSGSGKKLADTAVTLAKEILR
ncbi:hypothetical protein [Mumia sp. DW29H23]|uniref:hypothetical protein n=1 Tax=Mumia sp. DW29H23 TaxID=3421241 RepID=UPI003D697B36